MEHSLRILIVEDEFLIALDLADLLADFGHDVCGVARSAAQAERMAVDLRPDLILTDINLAEGSSGIEAARVIRSRLAIPSVFLSAQADRRLAADLADQSLGCLQKPCQPALLRRTLQDAARHMAMAA